MAWQFIGGTGTGQALAASGTTGTLPFPGGPFPASGAFLDRAGSGVVGIVPSISIPQHNLPPSQRSGGISQQPEAPVAWHDELYQDFTGIAEGHEGNIVPSGTRIDKYPRLTVSELENFEIHKLLGKIRQKYSRSEIVYGQAQTGGSAIVAPSGGTQVLFPGQSSSGVV